MARIVRWALAAVIAAWALFNLVPIASAVTYKLGALDPVPPDMQRIAPLLGATSWMQLALWCAVVVVLLAAAWRLARQRPALVLFLAGVALDIANWGVMQLGGVFQQVFTQEEQAQDYEIFALCAVAAVAIWALERRRARGAA